MVNIPEYINNHQMHLNVYDAFFLRRSHQHVSAVIMTIFRVMLLS